MSDGSAIDVTKFTDNIIKGRFTMKNLFGGLIFQTVTKNDVYAQLMEARTHVNRVHIIGDQFPFQEFESILRPVHSLLEKNTGIAIVLKEKAEVYRKSMNIPNALRAYNLALSFTPRGNLGLLIELLGQRAVLRLAINDKEGALKDMRLAMAYDPDYASMLCLSTIYEEVVHDELSQMGYNEERQHRDNVMFKVPGVTHLDCCTIGNFVSLVTSQERGRYLSVTEELRPGTTVIVEDPFVTVLDAALKWDTKHCARCFKEINGGYPCPGCVFVVYCGLTCQHEDYRKGHHYECSCYPFLHAIRASGNLHLALKSVSKAGPENLHALFLASKNSPTLNSESHFPDGAQYSFPITSEGNPYHRILKLKYHVAHADLPNSSWLAISLAHILAKSTDFFDVTLGEGHEKKEFVQFVASVIVHHELAFECNSRGIYRHSEIRDVVAHFNRNSMGEKLVGIGVYPIVSLISHSCSPNLMRKQLLNGRLAVITNRRLMCGDELLDSYGYEFLGQPLAERRVGLTMNHWFTCQCLACTHNWPDFWDLPSDFKFICQRCAGKSNNLSYIDTLKCILIQEGDMSKCNKCQSVFSTHLLNEEVAKYTEIAVGAETCVIRKRPCIAIPILIDCIEYFQKTLLYPNVNMVSSQIMLGEAYEIILGNSN